MSLNHDFPPPISPLPDKEPWFMRDHTDRSLSDYSRITGVDFTSFVGQTVLDIGSGESARFVREAQSIGINAIGINPNWPGGISELPPGCSAALAEKLPFKDKSFDFVIALGSIPLYLPQDETSYRSAFEEVHRVLKPGGWALIDPVHVNFDTRFPGFRKVLDGAFPHNWLVVDSMLPKLVVACEPNDNTLGQIATHLPTMNQSCFPLW